MIVRNQVLRAFMPSTTCCTAEYHFEVTSIQLVAHMPQLRNTSTGVIKTFGHSVFSHTWIIFSQTQTNTESVQKVITLSKVESRGGGTHHTSWGSCFLRFFSYFSCGPCCCFPLLRGHFVADVIVDPSLHFRVKSDGGVPRGTCPYILSLQII